MLRLCGARSSVRSWGLPFVPGHRCSHEWLDQNDGTCRRTAVRGEVYGVAQFIVLLDPGKSGMSKGRVRGEQPTSQWRHYHAVP
jgi:hypothetical protein